MPKSNSSSIQEKRTVKDVKKTIGRILHFMKGYRLHLALVFLLVLISAGAQIAGTYFLKPLINLYILPFIGEESPDLSSFIQALSLMAFVYFLGALSTYVYNRIMVAISTGTLYKIRVQLFEHMQTMPVKYFDTNTHGDLMSRYTNDIDALRNMLSQSFVQIMNSAVTVIGVFFAMLFLSPILTLIVLFVLAAIIFTTKFLGGRSSRYFMIQQQSVGSLNGYIEEMMEGQKVVKVFNYEEKAKDIFEQKNEELYRHSRGAQAFSSMLRPIMINISYTHYAITAMVGAILVVTRGFDLGSLASFLQYTRSFSMPITQISEQFNSIVLALAGADRIFEVIDTPSEVDDGHVTLVYGKKDKNGNIVESHDKTGFLTWKQLHNDGTATYTKVLGDIQFNNVTFGYDKDKIVLNNISLYGNPGQKVAFVGSTGAGKTTITNLINRFYDITDGEIYYDGINIKKIKKSDLRKTLSLVLQDTHLFTGSILDNIRYGRLDATDEEAKEAAKLANADSFIRHLPKGYDTVITADGNNLSQGQKQLLSIARAAIADPPVLILDEATSSIDTRTEKLIEKGMDQLMEGRTTFVIAHRLSTVRNSDVILVIENGEIIERGSHDDLLEQRGKYYQLYTGMFELS